MRLSILQIMSLLIAAVLFTMVDAAPQAFPCNPLGLPDVSVLNGQNLQSELNPIDKLYPVQVTGTMNGTINLVPIPYADARAIVPSKYAILKNQYEAILPGFPADHFPMVVWAVAHHDVRVSDFANISDIQAVHVFYPFVDLFGDGTSFAYDKVFVVSTESQIARDGATSYGEIPYPATYIPEGNAYAFTNDAPGCKEFFFQAYTNGTDCPTLSIRSEPHPTLGPWPMEFYVNVTNQIVFASGVTCSQQITLFNTTLSTGKNAPVGVKSDIFVAAPLIPQSKYFKGVNGVKVDIAFIQNNFLPCTNFKRL